MEIQVLSEKLLWNGVDKELHGGGRNIRLFSYERASRIQMEFSGKSAHA